MHLNSVWIKIQKIGGTAFAYTVDITNRQKIYAAAKEVKQDVGTVSILINNAGIVSGSALLNTPDEKIIRTFDVNVLAHFWTIKSFMPDMILNKKGQSWIYDFKILFGLCLEISPSLSKLWWTG